MTQTLIRRETGERLMVVMIKKQSQGGGMTMNLVLPHGLYLPSGVSYQVGSNAKSTAVIFSSDQNGAYATVPISPDFLTALKAGTTLNIGLETVSRNPFVIPVSLTGFSAAVDRLAGIK